MKEHRHQGLAFENILFPVQKLRKKEERHLHSLKKERRAAAFIVITLPKVFIRHTLWCSVSKILTGYTNLWNQVASLNNV